MLGSNICDPALIKKELEAVRVTEIHTLDGAINDLPVLKSGEGIPISGSNILLESDEEIWGPKKPRPVIFGHVARPHNDIDLEIIETLKQGMTYKQLSEQYPGILERRKKSQYKVYNTKNFHDKFYRMINNQPSRTIVSHLAKDGNSFIHPIQNRSITPREAARLQSFDDDFGNGRV